MKYIAAPDERVEVVEFEASGPATKEDSLITKSETDNHVSNTSAMTSVPGPLPAQSSDASDADAAAGTVSRLPVMQAVMTSNFSETILNSKRCAKSFNSDLKCSSLFFRQLKSVTHYWLR